MPRKPPASTPAKPPSGRRRVTPKKDATPAVSAMTEAEPSDAVRARALVAYRTEGTVKAACKAASISRQTWYRWLQADPAFAAAVGEAEQDVADDLEAAALTRAKAADGSDTLLIFLLKNLRRERFGEKRTIDLVSPEVRERLREQLRVILAQDQWDTPALLDAIDKVWQERAA